MRELLPERGVATARGAPAHGWQVPSESVGVGVFWQSPVVGSSCPRLTAPTAAGGGRLNLASSRAIHYRFPPPAGRLEAAMPGGGFRAIARASGLPGGPAAAPHPSLLGSGPRARRSGGGRTWGPPTAGWTAAHSRPGTAAGSQLSKTLHRGVRGIDSSVGVRVGLLIPKATG
jgi:hypothetical protein